MWIAILILLNELKSKKGIKQLCLILFFVKFRILLGNVMVEVGYGMMKALNCKVRFCV